MTYLELYRKACRMVDCGDITLGEFDEMIKPLSCEINTQTDTISRQDAIDALGKDIMGGLNYESILKCLPSAQPVIIRCKDCKDWEKQVGDFDHALGRCNLWERNLVMSNGFCCWGERRTDE